MDVTVNIEQDIDVVAVYAAIVATAVLIWEVYKWFRSGAQLRSFIQPNMECVGGRLEDDNTYLVLNVKNVGTAPTTITNVTLHTFDNAWKRIRNIPTKSLVVLDASPMQLPHTLEVGKYALGMIKQTEELEQMSRTALLYCNVHHTFSEKPIVLRIQPITHIPDRGQS